MSVVMDMEESNSTLANEFLAQAVPSETASAPDIVLPGDCAGSRIQNITSNSVGKGQVSIGKGLTLSNESMEVHCSLAGTFRHKEKILANTSGKSASNTVDSFWVDPAGEVEVKKGNNNGAKTSSGAVHRFQPHRYIHPTAGDMVLGVVEDKTADFFKVGVNGCGSMLLHRIEGFEGASKRNKPELKRGAVVYAKVAPGRVGGPQAVASSSSSSSSLTWQDGAFELTCTAGGSGLKKTWNSGEAVFGELTDGLLLPISTPMVRYLLRPDCRLLNCLGSLLAFEVVVGVNGFVWMKTGSTSAKGAGVGATGVLNYVVIRNAILNTEQLLQQQNQASSSSSLLDMQVEAMVQRLMQTRNLHAAAVLPEQQGKA